MSEAEQAANLAKLLASLGTNAILLTVLYFVFKAWREDKKQSDATLTGMITRYEALLERNAQVLTSLESKIE